MTIRSFFLFVACFMCFVISNAQEKHSLEFCCICNNDISLTCSTYQRSDSEFVISNLFDEKSVAKEVVFTFCDNSVWLTIDGQKGLFWGDSKTGSWNTSGNESERFTITWDSLCLSNNEETIYKFKFTPYYNEENKYVMDDETIVFNEYCDETIFYWTFSNGVVAISGEFLFVRKDMENIIQYLRSDKRCYQK